MKKNITSFAIAFFLYSSLQWGCLLDNILFEYSGRVYAQESATAPSVKEIQRINQVNESALMNSLLERQKQLDSREKLLKDEEKRVEALKREVAEKMEQLKGLEDSLSPTIEAKKADKEKKYVTIAKMYEATPPEKVAAILEKMDAKVAAEVIIRMNSKKAGAVWARMNNETSAAIVREITAAQSIEMKRTEKEEDIKAESVNVKDIALPDTAKNIVGKETKEIEADKTKKDQKDRKKPFSIQISAVRDIEGAQKQVEELKAKGFDARISKTELGDKGTWFRIMVGNFSSRAEAFKYMKNRKLDIMYPGSHVPAKKSLPKSKAKNQ